MAMALLWMLMEKVVGLHDELIELHPKYTMFILIPSIIIMVLAYIDLNKNKYDGKMKFKHAFISGFVIALIMTAAAPLMQIITSEIITPEYFNNAIEGSVKYYDWAYEKAKAHFNLENYIVQSTKATFGMSMIYTLIFTIIYGIKNRAK